MHDSSGSISGMAPPARTAVYPEGMGSMNFADLREPVSSFTHLAWLLLAIPGTWLLWRRGRSQMSRRVALLIFGLSLMICYGASFLYHGVRVPADEIMAYAVADYIGIFVLIAGTVTPIAWTILEGRLRRNVLVLTWGVAAAGTLQNLIWGTPPLAFATVCYMAMGWGGVFCYFELARRISHRAMIPIVNGGVCYSVGAILNLMEWPAFYPGVFGHHELFHVFVMAGSLAHFWFILTVVAPYRRPSMPEAVTVAGDPSPARLTARQVAPG